MLISFFRNKSLLIFAFFSLLIFGTLCLLSCNNDKKPESDKPAVVEEKNDGTGAKSLDDEKKSQEEEKETEESESEFFGFEDEEEKDIDYIEDSPEYIKDRELLFMDPVKRLGTKPLRLTLEDCIRIALTNNHKVQATEYGIDSARAQHEEASARFWPVFEYEWLSAPVPSDVTHAPRNFFMGKLAWWNKIKVAMGLPVYSFGKLSIAQDLAMGGIKAARQRRSKEKLSTVTKIRQLYYGVLLAEEIGRLLVNAHNKLSSEVKPDEDEDERSPIDKIKGNVFLIDIERRLAETREKELLALEGIRVQMGLSPDVSVMVYSKKLRPMKNELRPVDDYIKTALERRPDVKLVEIGVATRKNQYKLEKRKFLPDIGVGAYVDFGRTSKEIKGLTTTDDYSNPFNFARAGIGMRLEGRFDVHGQKARVKKARSEYYKASLEHYMAKDGIVLDVKKAYMEAKRALGDVRRADKAQTYARQLMFLTQSNFELGVGDEEEYTNALEMVLLTRGKYFEAVFNYNIQLAILEEKAGIIPEIGLYAGKVNK